MRYVLEISSDILKNNNVTQTVSIFSNILHYYFLEESEENTYQNENYSICENKIIFTIYFEKEDVDKCILLIFYLKKNSPKNNNISYNIDCIYTDNITTKLLYGSKDYLKESITNGKNIVPKTNTSPLITLRKIKQEDKTIT
jgi:hypothetical protein